MRFRLILSIMNVKILQRIKDNNYGNNIFVEIKKKKITWKNKKEYIIDIKMN